MPKFNLLRSYTVVESHEVEAKNEDEAIQIIENGSVGTHFSKANGKSVYQLKSYAVDFDKHEDGSILYTLEGCEDE